VVAINFTVQPILFVRITYSVSLNMRFAAYPILVEVTNISLPLLVIAISKAVKISHIKELLQTTWTVSRTMIPDDER
jgi:hypothetical protein